MPLGIFGKQKIQYYITSSKSLSKSLVVSLVNSWPGHKKQVFWQKINCIQLKKQSRDEFELEFSDSSEPEL